MATCSQAMRHVHMSSQSLQTLQLKTPRVMSTQAKTHAKLYKCSHSSLAKDGLDLGIQGLPLRRLATHRAEALDAKLLACLPGRVTPLLQRTRSEPLLAACRTRLAHDLTSLALGQGCLGQPTDGFCLLAREDRKLSTLTLRNGANFLDLHCLPH